MKCQCNKNSCADLGSEDSFGKGGRFDWLSLSDRPFGL